MNPINDPPQAVDDAFNVDEGAMLQLDLAVDDIDVDDGLLAAQEIRRLHPAIGVLVLSHHLDSRYAMRLLEEA